jgi:8-oxo-dGTP diphosphatase/putative hydrolase of the HAD superfamily
MIKAVLLDIGGPINDEREQERLFDAAALAAARQIREVSDEDYAALCRSVVKSFAPRAYRAIIWDLAGRDDARFQQMCNYVRGSNFERFNPWPEVPDVLRKLAQDYRLGIVANSGEDMIAKLEAANLLAHFTSHMTADMIGYFKPDIRYFARVLGELRAVPEEAVMVGDRIDCDVAPAKALGLKAVRLRVGRHREQEPRMPAEMPDAEIYSIAELPGILEQWQ